MQDLIKRLSLHVEEEQRAKASALASGGQEEVPTMNLLPPFPCCYQNDEPMHIAAAWLYQCKLLAMQVIIVYVYVYMGVGVGVDINV